MNLRFDILRWRKGPPEKKNWCAQRDPCCFLVGVGESLFFLKKKEILNLTRNNNNKNFNYFDWSFCIVHNHPYFRQIGLINCCTF